MCLSVRRTACLKDETDIITSPMGRAAILVIMYVKTFKTNIIVFIGSIIMCLASHDNFQY